MVVVKSTAKPITFGRVELDFYYSYFYHKAGLMRTISLPAQMWKKSTTRKPHLKKD